MDPYKVWLSEVMLQQTTVATVGPYYQRFLARWPTVEALAAAPLEDVMAAWAGLGYYARARKLHECAKVVSETLGGRFPAAEAALLKLPGIGPYTAAAISAISFGAPATVVDGNVERVIARLFAIEEALRVAKFEIKERTASLVPARRAGDFAQAMMDLGATICTPSRPTCALCPWLEICEARRRGLTDVLPRKAEKPERPTRRGVAFFIQDTRGFILLRRRPPKGLLGGMLEVPSTPWRKERWQHTDTLKHAPIDATWHKRVGEVTHTFTHFHLVLDVLTAQSSGQSGPEGQWADPSQVNALALPTVMKKVISLGLRD